MFKITAADDRCFALIVCEDVMDGKMTWEIKVVENSVTTNFNIPLDRSVSVVTSLLQHPTIAENEKVSKELKRWLAQKNAELDVLNKRREGRERILKLIFKLDPTVEEVKLEFETTDYFMYSHLQFWSSFDAVIVRYTNGDKLVLTYGRDHRIVVKLNGEKLDTSSTIVHRGLFHIVRAVKKVGRCAFGYREIMTAILRIPVVDSLPEDQMRAAILESETRKVSKLTGKKLLEAYRSLPISCSDIVEDGIEQRDDDSDSDSDSD
jgi:hypothetical protein